MYFYPFGTQNLPFPHIFTHISLSEIIPDTHTLIHSYTDTEQDMIMLFSSYGEVAECKIVEEADRKGLPPCAFLRFTTRWVYRGV